MKLKWLEMVKKEKGNTVSDGGRRNRRLEPYEVRSYFIFLICFSTMTMLIMLYIYFS